MKRSRKLQPEDKEILPLTEAMESQGSATPPVTQPGLTAEVKIYFVCVSEPAVLLKH